MRGRREIVIERENDTKMNMKKKGVTKKDETDMEIESIWN